MPPDVGFFRGTSASLSYVDSRLALRRPYTFVVMALLIIILYADHHLRRTPVDIFPDIKYSGR